MSSEDVTVEGKSVRLIGDHPTKTGGLQYALCVAEEYFETAAWIEHRRKQAVEFGEENSVVARYSLAHHLCCIGLEIGFKVLYDQERELKGAPRESTGHSLKHVVEKITEQSGNLKSLYSEHCAGRLDPIALCEGKHPDHVEGANLDTLGGFCAYADDLGKWAAARYHWQEPNVWMYRLKDLGPVIAFGIAVVKLAAQLQESTFPLQATLLKDGEEAALHPYWALIGLGQNRRETPNMTMKIGAVRNSTPERLE